MKKTLITLFLLIMSLSLFAAMNATYKEHPTSVELKWSKVPRAVFYDIYNDNEFITRLDSNKTSYTLENLLSNKEQNITLAARDANNKDLDAAWIKAKTTSWDGTYKWVNNTKDTNKGKMKSLTLRTVTEYDPKVGQYQRIFFSTDGVDEFLVFPIFDFDDPRTNEKHKFKEDSESGEAYRQNVSLVNTSAFKPSEWRITKMEIMPDSVTLVVETKVMGMTLTTDTIITFKEDQNGNKTAEVLYQGEEKLSDKFLFKNPNPNEGDAFVLKKIK